MIEIKMKKQIQKKIKEKIADCEHEANGFDYRGFAPSIKVVNLKILKDKYVADVIIIDHEEKTTERFDEVEYPLSIMGGKNEK